MLNTNRQTGQLQKPLIGTTRLVLSVLRLVSLTAYKKFVFLSNLRAIQNHGMRWGGRAFRPQQRLATST